jgi:hypothetical protein
MGLGRKVHREQLEAGLPAELAGEFHRLVDWARTLPVRFGDRVTLRLVDVASIEGFFRSLIHRIHRYPAFVVNGKRYVGNDFGRVDALILAGLGTGNILAPSPEGPG